MSERYTPPQGDEETTDNDSATDKKSARFVNAARSFMGQSSERIKSESAVNRLPPLEMIIRHEEDDDDEEETKDKPTKANAGLPKLPNAALLAPDLKPANVELPDSEESSDTEAADQTAEGTPADTDVFELPEVQAEGYGAVAYEELDSQPRATSEDEVSEPVPAATPASRRSRFAATPFTRSLASPVPVAAATDSGSGDTYGVPNFDYQPTTSEQPVEADGVPFVEASDGADSGGSGGEGGSDWDSFDRYDDGQGPETPPPLDSYASFDSGRASTEAYGSPNTVPQPEYSGLTPNAAAGLVLIEHYLGKRADNKITSEMRDRMSTFNNIITDTNLEASTMGNRQDRLAAAQNEAAQLAESQRSSIDELKRFVEATQLSQAEVTTVASAPAEQVTAEAPRQALNRAMPPVAPPLFPPVFGERRQYGAPLGQSEMPSPYGNGFEASRVGDRTDVTSSRMGDILEQRQNGSTEGMAPNTDLYAEANVRPSVVMEQVAQAAEQDMPVEIAYERRHEVRDDPGSAGSSQGGGAASVGSILTDRYQAPEASARQLAETQAYLSMNRQDSHQTGMSYGGAMKGGFAVGMVVAIVAAIAYVVFQ